MLRGVLSVLRGFPSRCDASPRSISVARSATAPTRTWCHIQVPARVRVSVRAVCFPSTGGRSAGPAQCVLSMRDRADMFGVAADFSVADKVVEHQSIWDRPNLPLIAHAVNELCAPIFSHKSVADSIMRPLPDVAAVLLYDPADSRGTATLRCSVVGDKRARYRRILSRPFLRRQVLHRPSGSRLSSVRRWPATQYLCFTPSNVTRSGATRNHESEA